MYPLDLKHTVSKTQNDNASLMKSEFVIKTVQGSNSLARRSVANTEDDMLKKGNVRNQQKCSRTKSGVPTFLQRNTEKMYLKESHGFQPLLLQKQIKIDDL